MGDFSSVERKLMPTDLSLCVPKHTHFLIVIENDALVFPTWTDTNLSSKIN